MRVFSLLLLAIAAVISEAAQIPLGKFGSLTTTGATSATLNLDLPILGQAAQIGVSGGFSNGKFSVSSFNLQAPIEFSNLTLDSGAITVDSVDLEIELTDSDLESTVVHVNGSVVLHAVLSPTLTLALDVQLPTTNAQFAIAASLVGASSTAKSTTDLKAGLPQNIDLQDLVFIFSEFTGTFAGRAVQPGCNVFAHASLDQAALNPVNDASSDGSVALIGLFEDKDFWLQADLTNLNLFQTKLQVQHAALRVASQSPFLSIDLELQSEGGVLAVPSGDSVAWKATGTWTDTEWTIFGSLAASAPSQTRTIGQGTSFTLEDLSLGVHKTIGIPSLFVASVNASATLAGMDFAFESRFDSNQTTLGCDSFLLKAVSSGTGISANQLLSSDFGGSASLAQQTNSNVPTLASGDALGKDLVNLVIQVRPECHHYQVSAAVDSHYFGASNFGLDVKKNGPEWGWHLWMLPEPSYKLGESSLIPAQFPKDKLQVSELVAVLSSTHSEPSLEILVAGSSGQKNLAIQTVPGSFELVAKMDINQPEYAPIQGMSTSHVANLDLKAQLLFSDKHDVRFLATASIDNLDIGTDFQISDAKIVIDTDGEPEQAQLEIASQSPYFSLQAQLGLLHGVMSAPSGTVFDVTADWTASDISFTGDLEHTKNWRLDVGTGFELTNLTLALTHSKSASTVTTAHVNAEWHMSTVELHLRMDFPHSAVSGRWGAGCDVVQISVDDDGSDAITFGKLSEGLLGKKHTYPKAIESIADNFNSAGLSDIHLELAVNDPANCGDKQFSMQVNAGPIGTGEAGLFLQRLGEMDYAAHAWFRPGDDFKLGSSFAVGNQLLGSIPDLDINRGLFCLSTSNTPAGSQISLSDGQQALDLTVEPESLVLDARLMLDAESGVALAQKLAPGVDQVHINGLFDETGFVLKGDLEQDQPVTIEHFDLTAAKLNVVHNKTTDFFGCQFQVDASIPLKDGKTGQFSVSALYDKNEEIQFNGTETASGSIDIDIGHSGFHVEDLHVSVTLDDSNGWKWSDGNLGGKCAIGATGVLDLEVDLLSIGKLDVQFTLTYTRDPSQAESLRLDDVANHVSGQSLASQNLPGDMKSKVQSGLFLDELQIKLVSSPLDISAEGLVEWHEGQDSLDCKLDIGKVQGGSWGVSAGIMFEEGAKPTDVSSSMSVVHGHDFAEIVVGFSTVEKHVTFDEDKSTPLDFLAGFNFFAVIHLDGNSHKGMASIGKMAKADSIVVSANIDGWDKFEIQALIEGNFEMMKIFDLSAFGFFIRIDGDDVSIGVEVDMNVQVSHRPQDKLFFHSDFFVGTMGLGFDAAMTKNWIDPLGATGVTIDCTDVSLEVDYDLVPTHVGFAGGLHIGDIGGDAAFYVSDSPFELMFYAHLTNIYLYEFIDPLMPKGWTTEKNFVDTVFNIGFTALTIEFNPSPKPLTFFGQVFQPGFLFNVSQFEMWDVIKGSGLLMINQARGFHMHMELDPIDLLDGLIKIGGDDHGKGPAILDFALMHSPTQNDFIINGSIDIFGEYLSVGVDIDDSKFHLAIELSLLDDMLDFKLDADAVGPIKKPTDFSVSATVTDHFFDWLETQVPKEIEAAKNDMNGHLNDAIADLNTKKASLDSINAQIARDKAQDQAKFAPAEAKLHHVQAELSSKMAAAKSISDEIAAKHVSHDQCHHGLRGTFCRVKYDAEIAGLWVTQKVKEAAIDVAKEAVKIAEGAVHVVSELDPRVGALYVKKGLLEAAYDIAITAVKVAKGIADAALDVVSAIAKAIGDILNIEVIELSGSLKALKQGSLGDIYIKGVFIGIHFEFNLDLDFNAVGDVLTDLAAAVKDVFHHNSGGGNGHTAVACQMSAWSAWSQCSLECGSGTQVRTRDVVTAPANGGTVCPTTLSQGMTCNVEVCVPGCNPGCGDHGACAATDECTCHDDYSGAQCQTPPPRDCVVSAWQQWGECSEACDGGYKTRVRTVATSAAYGGQACPSLKDTIECNDEQCVPVPCTVQAWAAWGVCSKSCGPGQQVRHRAVNQPAKYGGTACPTLQESTVCDTICPVNCELSSWSSWQTCQSQETGQDGKMCGSGKHERTRTIKEAASHGGTCEATSQFALCDAGVCARNCETSSWSSWSSCSARCGGGQHSRTRSIVAHPVGNGLACPASSQLREEASCGTQVCQRSVNCQVSAWAAWGSCSAECGTGHRSRTRQEVNSPEYGGTACPTMLESGVCEARACVKPKPETLVSTLSAGCYLSSWDKRVLVDTLRTLQGYQASPHECAEICHSEGKSFAALTGTDCMCGQSPRTTRLTESLCNFVCAADSRSMCGGFFKANVYEIVVAQPHTTPSRYLGCYSHFLDELVLESSSMSVEGCQAAARLQGLRFAALRGARYCYGGRELSSKASLLRVGESECSLRCGGNSVQNCGGIFVDAVYDLESEISNSEPRAGAVSIGFNLE